MKKIIGLTGGIGSGKTAASDYFAEKGITVVDADVVSREVVEPEMPAWNDIRQHFGDEVLLGDRTLNRPALREIVFNDPEQRKILESFTHPRIRDEIIKQLQNATSDYVILSSPLLIESGQAALTSSVIVVDVSESTQISRTSSRDQNTPEQVKQIIAAQIRRDDRLSKADFILTNEGSLEELYQQIDELHESFLSESAH